MSRMEIAFEELNLNIVPFWSNGLVLTAGINEPGKFNPMTIGWGCLGFSWKKPIIMVAVRPTRYTYEFIESCESFTVCAFPSQYQKTLTLLGTKSGRDIDKLKESGLTPLPSTKVACPGFNEAELILECRKIYYDDLKPGNATEAVHDFYRTGDYHRLYCGEILAIHGESHYRRKAE
ncbi:MAG TPA: flavin reductase family protein [Bacillota bacterium]|nr:flavin reductase family protein [Bacillota bacterium]